MTWYINIRIFKENKIHFHVKCLIDCLLIARFDYFIRRLNYKNSWGNKYEQFFLYILF